MKVLHLLASGEIGGIETLLKNYAVESKHTHSFLFVWKGGAIAEQLKNLGFQVDILNVDKHKSSISLKKLLIQKVQSYNPDVLFTHHGAPFLRLMSIKIKERFPKIRVVFYAHSNAVDMFAYNNIFKRIIAKEIHGYTARKADRIIAISNSVANSICNSFRVDKRKIYICYNGVPIEHFSVALHEPEFKEKQSEIHLIYVGRLIKEKGVQNILEAIALLPKELDFKLNIIGDGSYRNHLEKQCEQLGITEIVSFFGTRKDIPHLLQSSNVFIHLPIWEEGFGITVVEAMACGLICICAKKGGLPEIINNNVDGYLVNGENHQEVAETIMKVFLDLSNGNCKEIKENAIKKANFFSITVYANKMDAYIDNIMQ